MTTAQPSVPSLAGASWLVDPRLVRLFSAIERDGDTAWVVGGAVRNTLLGRPVVDIDVATTALPGDVVARSAAAGLKPVPTGIEHGTITVVVEGHPYEVTTLRRDVETHGRHATVVFGRDWEADAHRRDFTMNALYVSLDGTIHDFVGGIADCLAGRVRFIGAAARRIDEDRLRILRFFRFHASYGRGPLDPEGLHATIVARDGLDGLSAERIGQETLKLVVAARAPGTVAAMSEAGILQRVLGRMADLSGFSGLHAFAESLGRVRRESDDAALFLAALAVWTEGDGLALGERLRLSHAQRDRMVEAVRSARRVGRDFDARALRRLVHEAGPGGARDGLALAAARGRIEPARAADSWDAAGSMAPMRLPIGGREVIGLGVRPGPEVGRVLEAAQARWVESDFTADAAELLAFCREISIEF